MEGIFAQFKLRMTLFSFATGVFRKEYNENRFSSLYRQICESEKLSEKKRLFYVGITRAKYYCYLSASDGNRVYKPLRDLILQSLSKIPDAKDRFFAVPCEDGEILENITPENSEYNTASARSFKGEIVRDWNLASFSGFVRSYHGTGKEKNKNEKII